MSTVGNEQVKTRTPKCARCRNHGYTVNLRGHKGFCPHKNCTCDLCDLVKERQEVSKRQIKLRRQQQQEEVLGMYVPVPPTVFSQGSACGINLDYLRVLFPRKRVDRLYAVLLQCNNDVNAAKATLQQEEHLEEASGSFMGLTKTSPPVPVMKMNKATQWPADCDQDTAGAASKTGGTMVTSSKGWQQCNLKNAGEFHHNVSHHGSFPYCWPRALPSQFPPSGPVSLPAHNVFGATSPPRFKDHIFNPEPFPPENSAPLEGFESTCSNVSGHAKAGEPIRETQRMTEPVCTSLLQPQPLTTSQGLAVSVPQMTSLENGCVNPNCTQLSSSTAKTSSWGGDPIYTSASSAMTWMDVPVSLPMPRTAIHFSLPPLPLPPLASGWDPRSLPPLPFLPASMTMTAPFPFPPPHLSDSPAVPHVKEVGSIPEKAGDVLTSPDDLILTAMENSSVKMKPDVKIAPGDNDISALEPCEDSEQFIDPTGF